jgi:ABC-2 type transport system ATP-binding protein
MTDQPIHAIEIQNLNKTYAATGKSSEKTALKHINLTIPRGSIFGLLGPNGAGKSTLINIMAGLVNKSSGTVKIWDYSIDTHMRQAKSSIGIVPQEINFDPFFTPAKLLDLHAGLYGVPPHKRQTEQLLQMMGLQDKANAYTRSLSGGMRRRLMVAKAMVHTPPILVLDEPTAGVDIELRQQLWDNVRAMNKQGVTVLLTTHYLEEAQQLCDRIAIIHRGEIVANDEKEALLSQVDGKEIKFRLDQDMIAIPDFLTPYSPRLENPKLLTIRFVPKEQNLGAILHGLQQSGFGITDLSTHERNLEDVFLDLTKT